LRLLRVLHGVNLFDLDDDFFLALDRLIQTPLDLIKFIDFPALSTDW
jgi:hypothetical protein